MGLFGKIVGIALVAVAVVATVSTFGATAPLAGTAFGAFAATKLGSILTLAAFTIGQTLAFAPGKFPAGIQTGTTVSGEDQPESFIVGWRYATAGALTYPTMSYDKNRWLVNRIELSDLPGCKLIRFAVDGEWVEIDPLAVDEKGLGVTGKYAGKLFIAYFDGSQTAAAQNMLDKFGDDPNYPYDASMINAGGCYAVVSARFDQELFPSQPAYRFEMRGIPLYDPRADSSVGGSGTQRWADKSTWQPTGNPFVIIYNILRGITLRDGSIWGGRVAAEDLPLADWFAAMNDCDEQVQIGDGIGDRYMAGFEIKVSDDPGEVIMEIAKAASGLVADVGGTWYPRAGSPDLPVFNITDDIMLDFEPVGHNPHSGLEQTANALTATYPDPSQIYEPREAPIRTNAAWEAEDGQRLMREISLGAVPFPGRAQIIAKELHEDERRQSKHILALPRSMASARPLQTVDFTSDHFGHAGKDFEISSIAVDLTTLNLQMIVREVNPADFTPPTIIDTTIPTPVSAGPETLVVTDFNAVAIGISDSSSTPRIPAYRVSWSDPPVDALGAIFELRITGTTEVVRTHRSQNVAALFDVVVGGIIPGQSYDIRMRYVANDRPTEWTPWLTRVAPGLLVNTIDIEPAAVTAPLIASGAVTNVKIADVAAVKVTGQLTDDQIAEVAAAKVAGQLTDAQLSAIAAAKVTGQLTDAQLFEISAGKVSGQLTDAQLSAIAAAKVTGQIAGTQITDGAISTPKLAAGSVVASKIAAGTITAGEIAAGTITASEIAAGSISGDRLIISDGSGNLWVNGNFAFGDTRGWATPPTGVSIVERDPSSGFGAVTAAPFRYFASIAPDTGGGEVNWSMVVPIPVSAGETYAIRAQVAGGGEGTNPDVDVIMSIGDEAGAFVGGSFTSFTPTSTAWQTFEKTFTIPAGGVVANLRLRRLAGAGKTAFVGDIQLIRKASGATLITPNSITSGQIAAKTVTAAEIAAGTITAGEIATSAITAEKISAGAISAAKIATGAVVTDKIAANAITAASGIIANAAVQTLSIAGNAVTLPLFSFDSTSEPITTSPSEFASVTNAGDAELAFAPVAMTVSFRLVYTPPLAENAQPVTMELRRGSDTIMTTTITELSPDGSTVSAQKIISFSIEAGAGTSVPETYSLRLSKNSTAFDVQISHKSISIVGYKR